MMNSKPKYDLVVLLHHLGLKSAFLPFVEGVIYMEFKTINEVRMVVGFGAMT